MVVLILILQSGRRIFLGRNRAKSVRRCFVRGRAARFIVRETDFIVVGARVPEGSRGYGQAVNPARVVKGFVDQGPVAVGTRLEIFENNAVEGGPSDRSVLWDAGLL